MALNLPLSLLIILWFAFIEIAISQSNTVQLLPFVSASTMRDNVLLQENNRTVPLATENLIPTNNSNSNDNNNHNNNNNNDKDANDNSLNQNRRDWRKPWLSNDEIQSVRVWTDAILHFLVMTHYYSYPPSNLSFC